MPTYGKHSKPYERVSDGPEGPQKQNQMSMDREVTRDVYEANEIAQEPVSKAEERADTQKVLDQMNDERDPVRARKKRRAAARAQQASLRPYRSSQSTDLNRGEA